jgi:uncharacterized membrane protein
MQIEDGFENGNGSGNAPPIRYSSPRRDGDVGEQPIQRRKKTNASARSQNRKPRIDGLALINLGLGALQLLATSRVARVIGLDDSPRNRLGLRLMGARRVALAVGGRFRKGSTILTWARAVGGIAELGLLGTAFVTTRSKRLPLAIGAVAGVTAADLWASRQREDTASDGDASTVPVRAVVTINRPTSAVYDLWRDFKNFPLFMTHVRSVTVQDRTRSHWAVSVTGRDDLEWDAVITDDQPNALIAWRSVEGADVFHGGEVRFVAAPGNRGTEVHVTMNVLPPAGGLGKAVAKLFHRIPEQIVAADMKRLKQLLELGEVVRSDASIHRKMHPAQPSAKAVPGAIRSERNVRGEQR